MSLTTAMASGGEVWLRPPGFNDQAWGDVALLSVWISLSCGSELQLSREQIDAKTGLKIHFPSTWTIDGTDPFTIVDFRPRKRPPQALVPMGGAPISIGAPPQRKIVSIADWLRFDRLSFVSGELTEKVISNRYWGPRKVVIARPRSSVIPTKAKHLIVYYFKLGFGRVPPS